MSAQEIPIDMMPPVVWEKYKELLDLTEVEPTVVRVNIGTIALVHTGERVRLTIRYKNHKNHKYQWTEQETELHIDGEYVRPVRHCAHYAAIFADPDKGRHTWTPKGAKKVDVGHLRKLTDEQIQYAPHPIATLARALEQFNFRDSSTVQILTSGDNRYAVKVTNEHGASVYIHLKPSRGDWDLDRHVVVNANGYDLTSWYADDIDDLILELLGVASRKAQVSFTPKGKVQSQAGTANSVAVRKNTVIRN